MQENKGFPFLQGVEEVWLLSNNEEKTGSLLPT